MAKQNYICGDCHHIGYGKKIKRGNRKTEIFWWIVFTPLAILYSLYRILGATKCCENCGSVNIVKTNSVLLKKTFDDKKIDA